LLLETISGRFDKKAKKFGVFKVETIGDCYVAVTGIPRPQGKHALIMTRFAQECQTALRQELTKLAEILGDKTLDLAMRIGIHSGPVTAGVLRGEKARFQLFGDTMNTASRMESNGMADRIHVSEETANLLRKAGKAHWITQREDKIVAKGKGEMQTYWVNASSKALSSSATSCSSEDDGEEDVTLYADETDNAEELEFISQKLHERLSGPTSTTTLK
jgi:class 3 adenylate cyclase